MVVKKEVRLAPLASVLLFLLLINDANLNEVQVLLDTDCSIYSLIRHTPHFDGQSSCLEMIHLTSFYMNYKCLKMISNNSTSELDNQTCKFNYDAIFQDNPVILPLPDGLSLKDISWSCKLNNTRNLCDGASQCLTDECRCTGEYSTDVFFCLDGSGCISWSKLCNNIQDCKDGSDECFCHGHLVFFSPEVKQWGCFTEEHYCDSFFRAKPQINKTPEVLRNIDCKDSMRNRYNEQNENPIVLCLENDEVIEQNYVGSIELLSEFCRHNCSHIDGFDDGWARYCQNIIFGTTFSYLYSFLCNTTKFWEKISLAQVCDGTTDCINGADEFGCPFPDRFHCAPNVTAEWVHIDKVCDSLKDCSNGADECGTCQFEGLSSSEFLIQSRVIVAVTSIMGIAIIVLNLKEGYKCYVTSCASKIKAIDRIFLLQTFLYDSLMGIYICSIVLASIVLKVKGNYCLLEQEWRASPFCSTLGVIFSFSSHGSLMAIAAVSITRFLTCHSLFSQISKKAVIVISIIGACFNIFHSILPLLPINAIQDTFRTAVFFKNVNENPFLNKSSPFNRSYLTELYNKMFHDKGEHDIYEMSGKLSNITTKRDIFDLFEIGYYGNTGLCVHNIFKDHGENPIYRIYKILYCTILLVLLIIVSIAYIKIVLKMRNSAQATNSEAAASATAALTLKVALMIGSQLACWIPFIITVSYFQYLTQNPASPIVFEAFALVVIPINSFLNPVFHSELYKKVKAKVVEKFFSTKIKPSAEVGDEISAGLPKKRRPGNQFLEAEHSNQSIEAESRNQFSEAQTSKHSIEAESRNQFSEALTSNHSIEAESRNQFSEAQTSKQSIEAESRNQFSEAQTSNQSIEAEYRNQFSEAQTSKQSIEAESRNQFSEAQTSNHSIEAESRNQFSEAQTSNQSIEAESRNQFSEAQTSNQSIEAESRNQFSEAQTSNHSIEAESRNQFSEAQTSNHSLEAESQNQPAEIQPINQPEEVQPSNQSTEVQPSNQSTEEQPSNQSTAAQPSTQPEPTEVHASNQSTEVQPYNQSFEATEVQPSNHPAEEQPSNQSIEVHPSNQSTEVQSSNLNQILKSTL